MMYQDILQELGSTFQEVHDNLVKLGIKGVRRSCSFCPLANFIKRRLGFPAAAGWYSDLIDERQENPTSNADVLLKFAGHFDSGAYPELDEKQS
jgi:hypothetical protein